MFEAIGALLAARAFAIVAIDGMCGAGKTTLAQKIADRYGATLLHMDDFFLMPGQKYDGANADIARFRQEVLTPLLARRAFTFRPYNCAVQKLGAPVAVVPAPLAVVEGAYCMHPSLAPAYDYTVFVRTDPETQLARIRLRNGEAMAARFVSEWIPIENQYFAAFGIEQACDLVITT